MYYVGTLQPATTLSMSGADRVRYETAEQASVKYVTKEYSLKVRDYSEQRSVELFL